MGMCDVTEGYKWICVCIVLVRRCYAPKRSTIAAESTCIGSMESFAHCIYTLTIVVATPAQQLHRDGRGAAPQLSHVLNLPRPVLPVRPATYTYIHACVLVE